MCANTPTHMADVLYTERNFQQQLINNGRLRMASWMDVPTLEKFETKQNE